MSASRLLVALRCLLGAAMVLLMVARAAAEPASSSSASAATTTSAADRPKYAPKFRRFGPYDYLGTASEAGAYAVLELTQRNARSGTWKGPVLIDRTARDWFVADSKRGREAAGRWSDWIWDTTVGFPILDSTLTPLLRGGSFEISWNMSLMNFESFTFISLLIRMPHKWLGRTRPDSIGCAKDANYSAHCGNETLYASFPGGHVAVSMTGAGLVCAHHIHGQLYGTALADGLACASALTAATTVGWLRMRADSHWLSDQVIGAGLGLFSGYALPTLLHYHPFWRKESRASSETSSFHVAALPWIDEHTLGAALLIVN